MKRIVEKQCPICGKVTYMVIDAENYDQVMEYMVALYFNTKRKVVQKALSFLDKCLIKQILYQRIRSSILPMHLKFGNGCRWTILVRSFWFPKFPKMRKGNLDI